MHNISSSRFIHCVTTYIEPLPFITNLSPVANTSPLTVMPLLAAVPARASSYYSHLMLTDKHSNLDNSLLIVLVPFLGITGMLPLMSTLEIEF